MPANSDQLKIADLRTRIKDETLTPNYRVTLANELWDKYPSLKNHVRWIRPAVTCIMRAAINDSHLRSRCRGLLERMASYDPHAPEQPSAEPAAATTEPAAYRMNATGERIYNMSSFKDFCQAADDHVLPPRDHWVECLWSEGCVAAHPELVRAAIDRVTEMFRAAGLEGQSIDDYRKLEELIWNERADKYMVTNENGFLHPRVGWDLPVTVPDKERYEEGFLKLTADLSALAQIWNLKFADRRYSSGAKQTFNGSKP